MSTTFGTDFLYPLRPYQITAVERTLEMLDGGLDPLISAATGTGKAAMAAAVAVKHAMRSGKRVLLKVHRTELADQLIDWLDRLDPDHPAAREQADSHAESGYRKARYVVAMVQTVGAKIRRKKMADGQEERWRDVSRLKAFNPMEFGLVITDEGHHNDSAVWRGIDEHFRQNHTLRRFGLSATWVDADGAAKGMSCGYNAVSFRMGPAEAIREGWLVPLVTNPIVVDSVDWSSLPVNADGMYREGPLSEALREEEPLHKVVLATIDKARDQPVLAFGVDKKHVRALKAVFERYKPGQSRAVFDGRESDDRKEFLSSLGVSFQYGINCGVFTEGTDIPRVACVAVLRPCESDVLAVQIVGRAMRPQPGILDRKEVRDRMWSSAAERRRAIAGSAKPFARVLDFVSLSGRKLMTTADILGTDYPAPVRDYANRMIQNNPDRDHDVQDMLERASTEWSLIQEEIARRSGLKASGVRYQTSEVDLFDARTKTEAKRPQTVREALLATAGQVAVLVGRHGWSEERASNLSRKAAATILSKYDRKAAAQ